MKGKEFANKIWRKLKHMAREIGLFLRSGIFLKNFAGMIALVAVLFFCTTWFLTCYTKHGESLQVDNYKGMDLDDAMKKANNRSFAIVVSDSIYTPKQTPNIILSQNPVEFSRVKENRKIYVTVTKRIAPEHPLPDIIGGNDDFNTYSRKLKSMKFEPRIVGRVFDAKLESNTIKEVIYKGDTITNKLKDGVYAEEGAFIDCIVTEKKGGTVEIPNLMCMKYDAARFLIENYNINVGSVIEDATVTDRYSAYVWRQKPGYRAGRRIRIGEQINLYLTQYRPDDCTQGEESIEAGFGEEF